MCTAYLKCTTSYPCFILVFFSRVGYTGKNCEIEVDECQLQPSICLHGSCKSAAVVDPATDFGFMCSCDQFAGTYYLGLCIFPAPISLFPGPVFFLKNSAENYIQFTLDMFWHIWHETLCCIRLYKPKANVDALTMAKSSAACWQYSKIFRNSTRKKAIHHDHDDSKYFWSCRAVLWVQEEFLQTAWWTPLSERRNLLRRGNWGLCLRMCSWLHRSVAQKKLLYSKNLSFLGYIYT